MLIVVFLLGCVLQPILHYYCVLGKRESLQRFIVEAGAKPAIFGSYSYDPVRQVFVPPPPDTNDVNDTSKHHPTHSYTENDSQTSTQTDTPTYTEKYTQTDTPADPHQLTSTPSHHSIPDQSLQDSFISTAGDTGTDRPDDENKMLRKQVLPLDNKPWWIRPKTTFKNVTFKFI